MGHSNLIQPHFFFFLCVVFSNCSSHHISTMPARYELHAESKVGTPTLRSKVKRKCSPIGGTCPRRRTWSGIIREVMALVCIGGGGESGIGLGAVTHWFPSRWPPVLFPPRLQRLELVKCLGCTDLNSSYSPQKTLALANRPFFSIPIVFLCNEHTLCLCRKVPSCT